MSSVLACGICTFDVKAFNNKPHEFHIVCSVLFLLQLYTVICQRYIVYNEVMKTSLASDW